MEEIKHLKIETATHIFSKFMRVQEDVFYSCMHSFFTRTDVGAGGATDSLVQSVRWVEPDYRDDRPGLPLTIGSPVLPLYLLYLYIYILYLYITPGCIQYRECTQAEPTRQEHLVRANRPTQAEPMLCLRPSRTLPTECYNFRTRPAVASSYIDVAITPDQQLQLHQTNSCNHIF
jgi:hypothetical protein